MAYKTGKINLNYNLKSKTDKWSLVILVIYLDKRIKISTKQVAYVDAWDNKKKRCVTSSNYTDRINRASRKLNKFLDTLDISLKDLFDQHPFHLDNPNIFQTLGKYLYSDSDYVKKAIQKIIQNQIYGEVKEEEKKIITPLQFFKLYVDNMHKRIDPRTGNLISERTINHHKTVFKRFQAFFSEKYIKDDFSVFDRQFQEQFINWAYTNKNYSNNTVPASFSLLKVWLNEAAREGLIKDDTYKSYKSKGDVPDNIYLTEDEISRLYALDIPMLKSKGIIDAKSTIEETRDLFIIGCWTGLRQSDLNHLEKALFDVKAKEPTITVVTEKTSEKVLIPMHRYIKELYAKYAGKFPHMCYKSRFNEHLRELGRLAGIDDETIIQERRGGKTTSIKYKKYQLIKCHTARRSFATNLYLKGAPTISIMKLTGHTTESNFMKYIKVTREENAQLMQQFFK